MENILLKLDNTQEAHGFIRKRSIVTNARVHVQRDIIVNTDLKDFFPSIHFGRVKGLFRSLGYSEQQATVFALICTCAPAHEVEMDGVKYYVHQGKRVLPQGSPASPAISNLMAFKLDKKVKDWQMYWVLRIPDMLMILPFLPEKSRSISFPGCWAV